MPLSYKYIISLLVGCLLNIAVLIGQEYHFQVSHLSFEEGLSHRKVNSVTQDTLGLIWLATANGLNRFDGYGVKHYFKQTNGLRSNDIRQVFTAKSGKIWCVHWTNLRSKNYRYVHTKNIDVFDPLTEKAVPFNAFYKGPKDTSISSIYKGTDGWLYYLTDEGQIFREDQPEKALIDLPKNYTAYNFILNEKGVWLNGSNKIAHLSLDGQLLHQDSLDIYVEHLKFKNSTDIWLVPSSIFGVNDKHSSTLFCKSDYASVQPYEFQLNKYGANFTHRQVVNVNESIEAHLYGQRIYFYDNSRKQLLKELRLTVPYVDYAPNYTQVLVDDNEVLWISTTYGMIKIVLSENRFTCLLDGKSTRGILRLNSDSIFICTYKGPYMLNTQLDSLTSTHQRNTIVGLSFTQDSVIWAGMHGNVVLKIDQQGRVIEEVRPASEERPPVAFSVPYYDSLTQHIFWTSNRGVFVTDDATSLVKPFTNSRGQALLANQFVRQYLRDEEGLWFVSEKGIYLLNTEQELVHFDWTERYRACQYMYRDTDGIRWLAIKDGGLIRWNAANNEHKLLTMNEGLSNNNIYAIFEDDYGYLWLPSDFGLMRMNRKDLSIQTFFEEDGIAHNEFNYNSHFVDTDGRFYLGGLNGITVFHPSDFVEEKPSTASLQITGLKFVKFDDGIIENRTADFYRDQQITMFPDDQSFILNFSLIDHVKEGRPSYAYKIEGLDNTWTNINENFLRINRLPYGQYTLLLKGRYLGGNWSKELVEAPLFVKRPMYLTSWFLGGAAVLLLLLIGIAVKWRISWLKRDKERLQLEVERRTAQISRQAKELEALNRTKDRFFAIIAHDLRHPALAFRGLTKKVKYLIDKGQVERIPALGDAIDEAASGLNRLLDNLLNWSRLQNGRMPNYPQAVKLCPVVEENLSLFSNIAEVKAVSLQQQVPPHIDVYIDPDMLSLLLRNLLSNAIKFTPSGGQVGVSASLVQGQAHIQITDSGVGMDQQQVAELFELKGQSTVGTAGEKGTGLGLVLCKELVETSKGQIRVQSELNKGTQFILLLPLAPQSAHFVG